MAEVPKEIPISLETRGWARVGQVLSFALLHGLRKKGVFTDAEAHQVLDVALAAVEGTQMKHPDDQSVLIAREVLGAMIERLSPQQKRHK